MKTRAFLFFAWAIAAMSLLSSGCFDETAKEITDVKVIHIPYTVSVESGLDSKATLEGLDDLIFQEGDKLVITSEDETVSGELFLTEGGGLQEGTFEGTLDYTPVSGGDRPDDNLLLYARLVGPDDAIGDNPFVAAMTAKMPEAVKKYSTLTGSSRYIDKSFTLVQGTSFIMFTLRFEPNLPDDGTYLATLFNNESEQIVSGNVQVKSGKSEFVVALPSGTNLYHPRINLCGVDFKFGGKNATVLAVSTRYSVSQTHHNDYDLRSPLTLEAAEDGAIVIKNRLQLPITYEHYRGGVLKTRMEDDVDETISIDVEQGDVVSLYGKSACYGAVPYGSGFPATNIVPTGDCYVYGNVMSLIDPDNFVNATSFSAPWAFAGLFLNDEGLDIAHELYSLNTHIKSHESRNVVLPATQLTPGCYMYMFAGAQIERAPELKAESVPAYGYNAMFLDTRITAAPELPAIALSEGCYGGMFYKCTSMVSLPSILPAENLANTCYYNMFYNCTGLTEIPAGFLPASQMAGQCYAQMFSQCTSLTTIPANLLSSLTLAEMCYKNMFNGCASLTQAPALPATTLISQCYEGMFEGCTNLTSAPELPATTMASRCYDSMFEGCINLAIAPELPATTLASSCYDSMFKGCTSLTTAPYLLAERLVSNCYGSMFSGCSSLNYIRCFATNQSSSSSTSFTKDWVKDVASKGTFIVAPDVTGWTIGSNGIPEGWITMDPDLEQMLKHALTLEAVVDGTISVTGASVKQYKNGVLTSGTLNVVAGDIVSLVGDNTTLSGMRISSTGKCYISGNIMSLLSSTDYESMTEIPNGVSFSYMFYGARQITNHPEKELLLPALVLKNSCYNSMFAESGLSKAPDLPATTLANSCYTSMFSGCQSLVSAMDELPALDLTEYCYESMFYNCGSLITAPSIRAQNLAVHCCRRMFSGCNTMTTPPQTLPAMALASYCYYEMFYGCTRLASTPTLPATTVAANCYTRMFYECKALTQSPALPALTLEESCYEGMFYGCNNLTAVSEIKATTLAENSCCEMFESCSSMKTAPKLYATSLDKYCCRQMFKSCTALESVPNDMLPAVSMADACYSSMFADCQKLENAPQLVSSNLANDCYAQMFSNCINLKNAPNLNAINLASGCYEAMFAGCTSLESAPDLPAPKLEEYCYDSMFDGCTKLSSIKCLATDILADGCLSDWVNGVSASGTFTKAASMGAWPTGVDGIPSGWTVQNAE